MSTEGVTLSGAKFLAQLQMDRLSGDTWIDQGPKVQDIRICV